MTGRSPVLRERLTKRWKRIKEKMKASKILNAEQMKFLEELSLLEVGIFRAGDETPSEEIKQKFLKGLSNIEQDVHLPYLKRIFGERTLEKSGPAGEHLERLYVELWSVVETYKRLRSIL